MPPIGKLTRSTSLVVILSALALTLSACGTAGSQADGNKSEVGPGVTDTTIKVGFITRKASTAAGGGGFKTPAQGDVNAQVNALVEYINKNGGLGGRKITSVLKEYDSSAASVQKENDYCTAFTQDEKVFAVVLLGQRELSSKTCYKDAKTLMLDAGAVAQSAGGPSAGRARFAGRRDVDGEPFAGPSHARDPGHAGRFWRAEAALSEKSGAVSGVARCERIGGARRRVDRAALRTTVARRRKSRENPVQADLFGRSQHPVPKVQRHQRNQRRCNGVRQKGAQ